MPCHAHHHQQHHHHHHHHHCQYCLSGCDSDCLALQIFAAWVQCCWDVVKVGVFSLASLAMIPAKRPPQMSRFAKNSKEEDLDREDLLRILHNAELYDYMRLFEQSDTVGDWPRRVFFFSVSNKNTHVIYVNCRHYILSFPLEFNWCNHMWKMKDVKAEETWLQVGMTKL